MALAEIPAPQYEGVAEKERWEASGGAEVMLEKGTREPAPMLLLMLLPPSPDAVTARARVRALNTLDARVGDSTPPVGRLPPVTPCSDPSPSARAEEVKMEDTAVSTAEAMAGEVVSVAVGGGARMVVRVVRVVSLAAEQDGQGGEAEEEEEEKVAGASVAESPREGST